MAFQKVNSKDKPIGSFYPSRGDSYSRFVPSTASGVKLSPLIKNLKGGEFMSEGKIKKQKRGLLFGHVELSHPTAQDDKLTFWDSGIEDGFNVKLKRGKEAVKYDGWLEFGDKKTKVSLLDSVYRNESAPEYVPFQLQVKEDDHDFTIGIELSIEQARDLAKILTSCVTMYELKEKTIQEYGDRANNGR